MNNHEHQNDTNNDNDDSLSLANVTVTATNEKVEECINNIMDDIMDDICRYELHNKEEVEVAMRNLLSSIHRKEWKQALNYFLRLYDSNVYGDKSDKARASSIVLRHADKHHLQFPLGKEDNFEDFIDQMALTSMLQPRHIGVLIAHLS